ncbi:unnamed protein product [Cylicocyclus nassatus]|uniref:Fucosyltransferase n=1 Tax=Cylicocyclus nassatus TaxID=53992 RepID=A0AA36GJF9_CYLNA|nr:unnamed protein product [Cylicocyclus nassatus]
MQLSSVRSRLKRVYLNQRSRITKTALLATIVLILISPLLLNQISARRLRGDDNYVNENIEVKKTPLIVVWTKYWNEDMLKMLMPATENCAYQCKLIDRTELNNQTASAYLFHGPNIVLTDLPAQGPNHLNILIARESPLQLKKINSLQQASRSYYNNPLQSLFAKEELPRNYFNITITYKRSSRYFFPYGQLVPISPGDSRDSIFTKEEVRIALKKKKNGVLFYNCNTSSETLYLENIRKLGATEIIEEDKCERRISAGISAGSALCKPDCSSNDLVATHRFYIAFEDDICDDFISEKFYDQFSQLLVPIVRKRRIYRDAGVPRHSFIAVDDFDNFEDLREYLELLRRNDTEYLRYFEWTNDFRKPNTYRTDVLCKLCEDIHNKRASMVDDIENYLDVEQCLLLIVQKKSKIDLKYKKMRLEFYLLLFPLLSAAVDLESWAEAAENIKIDDIAPEIAKAKSYAFKLDIKPVNKKRVQKTLSKRIQKEMSKGMEKQAEDELKSFAHEGPKLFQARAELMHNQHQ